MKCPLCQLGYPQPHTATDWRNATSKLQRLWRMCEHGMMRFHCDRCISHDDFFGEPT